MRCSTVAFLLCVLLTGCGTSSDVSSTASSASLPAPPPVVLQAARLEVLEGSARTVVGTVDGRPVPLSLRLEDTSVARASGPQIVGLRSGRTRFTAYGEGSQAQGEVEVLSLAQVASRLSALTEQARELQSRLVAAEQGRARNATRLADLQGHIEGASATLTQIAGHLTAAARDDQASDVSASGRAIQALLPQLQAHLAGAAGPRLAVQDDLSALLLLVFNLTSQVTGSGSILFPNGTGGPGALIPGVNEPLYGGPVQNPLAINPQSPSATAQSLANAFQDLEQAVAVVKSAVTTFVEAAVQELGTAAEQSPAVTNILTEIASAVAGPGGAVAIAQDTLATNVAPQANTLLNAVNQALGKLNVVRQSVAQQSSQASAQNSPVSSQLSSVMAILQNIVQVMSATVQVPVGR